MAIEYNGEQHYRPVCFGGIEEEIAKINFDKQKIRDMVIKDFCIQNNIFLLEINANYFKFKKLKYIILNILIPYINEHIKK